jgi:DNA helicase-2/ATP-dependent DNA helicase PcrA
VFGFGTDSTTFARFVDDIQFEAAVSRELLARGGGEAGGPPSEVERVALAFERERKYAFAADLLVAINKEGARAHRPDVLRACIRALQSSTNSMEQTAFYDAVIRMREESRLQGRPLPARAVGSTLLLKGLEADVAVILHADELDARNLYVAMTRCSKHLVVCARRPILCG